MLFFCISKFDLLSKLSANSSSLCSRCFLCAFKRLFHCHPLSSNGNINSAVENSFWEIVLGFLFFSSFLLPRTCNQNQVLSPNKLLHYEMLCGSQWSRIKLTWLIEAAHICSSPYSLQRSLLSEVTMYCKLLQLNQD